MKKSSKKRKNSLQKWQLIFEESQQMRLDILLKKWQQLNLLV